jgi:hypothetical protein
LHDKIFAVFKGENKKEEITGGATLRISYL